MVRYGYCILLMLILSSCSAPYKLLEKGNYSGARSSALKQLSKNKNSKENLDVLVQAMDRILLEEREGVYRNIASDHPKDWKTAFSQSREISECILDTKIYVGDRYDQTLENMDNIHSEARSKLYEFYYQKGLSHLNYSKDHQNIAKAQEAHSFFLSARKYAPLGHNLDFLIEEALALGTIRIAVLAKTSFNFGLDRIIQNRFRRIEEHGSLFQVVDYQSFSPNHDVHIALDFDHDEDIYSKRTDRLSFETEILVRTDRMRDTSGSYVEVPIYDKITANVEVIEIGKNYELDVASFIVDQSDVFSFGSHRFRERHTEVLEYYEISGDERAVPDKYKDRCVRPEFDDEEVYEHLVDRMYQTVSDYYF